MNDSQSSDVFSESVDIFDDNHDMDLDSYDNILASIKLVLSEKCETRTSIKTDINSLLDDCILCISKTFELILNVLSESTVQLDKLIEFINNAVCLLQMLADYIKTLIKSMVLTYSNMETLPTKTGRILLIVFTHCKDSELIYRNYLGSVEKQLKDLFRVCHELQLTYLMVLEKHFIFDMNEEEEQNVLVEVLEINLKICETVQNLDVKTMAEQWKAYTAICEKYTSCLNSKNIFSDCTKVLCRMVEDNIKYAIEVNQVDSKLLTRTIKVTSFILKIVLKVCTIFKHSTMKKYDQILKLLIFMFLNSSPCIELQRPEIGNEFITLLNTNVSCPTECLIKELMSDEEFINIFVCYDVRTLINTDELLGYILLIVAAMKTEIQIDKANRINQAKNKYVDCIYRILPYCHISFNLGIKFLVEPKSHDGRTFGLYEHVLQHTVALVSLMNAEEYRLVEQCMIKAILGTDCISALFSANLWVLLSRFSSRQLFVNQLTTLCRFYKQFENDDSFQNSPQKVYLGYTISKLYQMMRLEDKIKLCEDFELDDNKNLCIWNVLKIRNVPEEFQMQFEKKLIEKLQLISTNFVVDSYEDVLYMINLFNLASTCSFSNELFLVEVVVNTWMTICPQDNVLMVNTLEIGPLWYIRFMESLIALTSSIAHVLCYRTEDLVRILFVISKVTQSCCLEIKLLLMDILCKFCTSQVYDENENTITCFVIQSLRNLMQDTEPILRNKLFYMLRANAANNNDLIMSKLIDNNPELRDVLLYCEKNNKNYLEEKRILEIPNNFKFHHKCPRTSNEIRETLHAGETSQTGGNNFDFVDIDILFDNESVSEQPLSKKVKLNSSEVDDVIAQMEVYVLRLCNMKENICTYEQKLKIRELCQSLQNMVD